MFDIVFIGNYPRVVRFAVLPKTRDGSHLALKRMHLRRGAQVRIRTERPLPVHMDGELFLEPTCGLSVELLPQALSVLA